MQEKLGNQETRASIEGSRLHDAVANTENSHQDRHQVVPILIIIVAIIIGYLWILG